jgi:phospholipid/cholesterol/gamma-HCH transport system substrate-binding protein
MTASRWHRVLRTGIVLIAATAVALLCGSWAPWTRPPHADYCAIMPDSVGLYVGNPVTQMGYQIGKVTAISPTDLDVRVDFTVTVPRALPADVKAVTRSTSILTDRSLELVGNFQSGPALPAGGCIARARSYTPKSLSEIIGSATQFVNSINPATSTNIAGVVSGVDQSLHNNGAGINQLLTTSSQVLDSPDQAITDIGSIITNLSQLTSALVEVKGPLKEALLNAQKTTPDVALSAHGGKNIFLGVNPLILIISDIEAELGPNEIQQTLDATEYALRKASAHATSIASLLKPFPVIINWLENHANDHQFNTIRYRPPMYRVRSPDGLLTCGLMNASAPGSCADVAGTPYSVDVDLLQYVLTQASR